MIRSLVDGRVQTSAADSTLEGPLDVRTTGTAGPTVSSFDYNIGAVAKPSPILGRDLGISAVSGDGTQVLWIFGDTFWAGPTAVNPTNDDAFRYTTAAIGTTAAAPGSMTTLTHQFDANGAPLEFVTPQLPKVGTVRFPFWPDSVFPHPTGTGWIVYYQRVRHETTASPYFPGYINVHVFAPDAVFVADVSKGSHTFSRTGNEVQVMDWTGMSSGCCLGQDGFIYLFTQTWLATIQHYCARVPHASYKTPTAYEYWTGSGWSTDKNLRKPVVMGGPGYDGLAGMGGITVTWNPYLGKYLMVHTHAKIPADHLCLRTATNPQGPYSEPTKLLTPTDPAAVGYGIYTAREHKWAQQSGGQVIFTSHWRASPSFLSGELKLTKITFA